MDEGQGGGEAVAAVRADHFEVPAGGAAPVEGVGQAFPFGGAFSAGGLEVDDPLAPVGKDAGGDREGPLRAPTPILRVGTTPSGMMALQRSVGRRRWKAATRLMVAGETGRRAGAAEPRRSCGRTGRA